MRRREGITFDHFISQIAFIIASGCIACVRLLCLSTLHCVTLHYIQNTHGTHGEYNLTYLHPSGCSITTLHDIALDCIVLYCIVLRCIALHYIALHYTIYILHCVALHYIHYMTLRDVALRYITFTTLTTLAVMLYFMCVCVRGRATAWCPTTRPYRLRPQFIAIWQIQLQHTPASKLENSFHSPVKTKYRSIPCASCRSIRSGAAWCSSSTMRSHLPAQSSLDESHFSCGKKTAFLATRIAISIGKISEKTDLYGFKNFQNCHFDKKTGCFMIWNP